VNIETPLFQLYRDGDEREYAEYTPGAVLRFIQLVKVSI